MNTDNHKQDSLDDLIKQVSQTDDQPGAQLNNLLKVRVHQKEALLRADENKRKISIWYLPMLLNSLAFITLDLILHVFVRNGIVLQIINGACIYLIIAGIILTIVGIKFSNLKTAFTFEWNKGGSLA